MRKIRYRQVLRSRVRNTGKVYSQQVKLQRLFWREDAITTPSISKVREIHSSIGTWDKLVRYENVFFEDGSVLNSLFCWKTDKYYYPKADYKKLNELMYEHCMEKTDEFLTSKGV